MHGCGDEDDRGVARGELFIPCRDAPPLFESIDTALNHIPLAIALLVKGDDASAIRARRNNGLDAAPAKGSSQSSAIVALVTRDAVGTQPGAPSESALTSRPLEELLEIVRKAEEAVGAAPCNEILAIHLIGNLRKIVTLEALHDQRVRFVPGFVFEPIPTVWLDDGGTSAASEAEGA